MWPDSCPCWLPSWLPTTSLASLMFEYRARRESAQRLGVPPETHHTPWREVLKEGTRPTAYTRPSNGCPQISAVLSCRSDRLCTRGAHHIPATLVHGLTSSVSSRYRRVHDGMGRTDTGRGQGGDLQQHARRLTLRLPTFSASMSGDPSLGLLGEEAIARLRISTSFRSRGYSSAARPAPVAHWSGHRQHASPRRARPV